MRTLPVDSKPLVSVIVPVYNCERFLAEAQKMLEAQFLQSQRMKSIGTLAGGIAHDFNNLLMGIQGNASVMLLDLNPSHDHFENVKSIERCVKSGANLTRQLLGFARGGKYVVKPIYINEVINRTSHIFSRTRKERYYLTKVSIPDIRCLNKEEIDELVGYTKHEFSECEACTFGNKCYRVQGIEEAIGLNVAWFQEVAYD